MMFEVSIAAFFVLAAWYVYRQHRALDLMQTMYEASYESGLRQGVRIAVTVTLLRMATAEDLTEEDRVKFGKSFLSFFEDEEKLKELMANLVVSDADVRTEE